MKRNFKKGDSLYVFYGMRESKPIYLKVAHKDKLYSSELNEYGWVDLKPSKSLNQWFEWKKEVWDNKPKKEYIPKSNDIKL